MSLGLKDLLARRGRAILLVAAIAVTTSAVVFAMCMQVTLQSRPANKPRDVPTELPALVDTFDTIPLGIAITTLVAVALLAVHERVNDFGVLRTIGLTRDQVTSSLAGAHAMVAVIAAILAMPARVAMYSGAYAAERTVTAHRYPSLRSPTTLTVVDDSHGATCSE